MNKRIEMMKNRLVTDKNHICINKFKTILKTEAENAYEMPVYRRGKTFTNILDNIPAHSRNNTLTSLAGLLHSRNIRDDMVLTLVSAVNSAQEDPLPDKEINTIVRSVSRYRRSCSGTSSGQAVRCW